jgi:hypothetical protein
MKQSWILGVAVAAACAGCTTTSLERQSLAQIHSTADYRCEAALNALVTVASDPANLPAFAVLSDGTAKVTDTGTVGSTTTWARPGFVRHAVPGRDGHALSPAAMDH